MAGHPREEDVRDFFEETLVSPPRQRLRETLAQAVTAANGRARKYRIVLSDAGLDAFLDGVYATAEGRRTWAVPQRRGRPSSEAVGVAWWSDPVGRRHVHVAGRQHPILEAGCLFGDEDDVKWPLRLVYADGAVVERAAGRESLRVLCACGAHGAPAEVGWMGQECAACHDRREAGEVVPVCWPRLSVPPPPVYLPNVREPWTWGLPHYGDLAYFTVDGASRLLGVGARLFSFRLWDLGTGAVVSELRGPTAPYEAALTPDGQWLVASLHEDTRLHWLDPATLAQRSVSNNPTSPRNETRLAFSPDGSLLAAWTAGEVRLVGVPSRLWIGTICVAGHDMRDLAWSPDGRSLAGACWSDGVFVWGARSGSLEARLPVRQAVAVAYSPDGGLVAFVADDTLSLWDGRSAATPRVVGSPGQGALCVAFSPDGRWLASAAGAWIVLYDTGGWQPRMRLRWHRQAVFHVGFTPDGRYLISASCDGHVRLWPLNAFVPSVA
jgi:hypothetical protein